MHAEAERRGAEADAQTKKAEACIKDLSLEKLGHLDILERVRKYQEDKPAKAK